MSEGVSSPPLGWRVDIAAGCSWSATVIGLGSKTCFSHSPRPVFPGESYCGGWAQLPRHYLTGLPCSCPPTAGHVALSVPRLLQSWLLSICMNTVGHSCPLAWMHWGGFMAHHCWTVLYHWSLDPTAGLGHCVQCAHAHQGF